MASRKHNIDKSERLDDEDTEEMIVEEKEIKPRQIETVKIISQRNMKINYTGKVSGKLYVFDGAGAVVNVNVEDADIMLAKRGGQCCEGSSSGPAPYFAKLEEG